MKCPPASRCHRRRSGYAVVVVLVVIVLLTALTALNIEVAVRLHRHVVRLDQRQQERWHATVHRPANSAEPVGIPQ